MSFVAEDGTGLALANSYATTAYADSYFSDRGIAAWTGVTAVKEQALVRATDYIEGRFAARFIGERNTTTQGLAWPRYDTVDFATNVVPDKLKRAACEYALRALSASLAPDPTVDVSGYSVVTTKEKVGPLETEYSVRGGDGASPMVFRPYPAADMLLAGLLVSAANRVIR